MKPECHRYLVVVLVVVAACALAIVAMVEWGGIRVTG